MSATNSNNTRYVSPDAVNQTHFSLNQDEPASSSTSRKSTPSSTPSRLPAAYVPGPFRVPAYLRQGPLVSGNEESYTRNGEAYACERYVCPADLMIVDVDAEMENASTSGDMDQVSERFSPLFVEQDTPSPEPFTDLYGASSRSTPSSEATGAGTPMSLATGVDRISETHSNDSLWEERNLSIDIDTDIELSDAPTPTSTPLEPLPETDFSVLHPTISASTSDMTNSQIDAEEMRVLQHIRNASRDLLKEAKNDKHNLRRRITAREWRIHHAEMAKIELQQKLEAERVRRASIASELYNLKYPDEDENAPLMRGYLKRQKQETTELIAARREIGQLRVKMQRLESRGGALKSAKKELEDTVKEERKEAERREKELSMFLVARRRIGELEGEVKRLRRLSGIPEDVEAQA